MTQIRGAVLVGRRADGDELIGAVGDARGDVGGELQPSGGRIPADDVLEPGLVNREFARAAGRRSWPVDVDAHDVVTRLGQTGAGHQTDITGAVQGDPHILLMSVMCERR